MKVSIVIAVLNSHKVVVRQIRHFKKMGLPNDVEIIFVDDGSNPPLNYQNCGLRNFYIFYTHDKRPWTQGLARNLGTSKANGEFIFVTDIDHIITREAIDAVRDFDGDTMVFPRYYGILDRRGNLICDYDSMMKFGAKPSRNMSGGFHGNTFAMRKRVFEAFGGYDRKYCETMFHVGGHYTSEEGALRRQYRKMMEAGLAKPSVIGPKVYFFPVGRYRVDDNHNPFGWFHDLSIDPTPQPMLP